MSEDILGSSEARQSLHYAVGALIDRDGKYLLIDRANLPFGFGGISGHMQEGETPEEALVREIREESGLDVLSFKTVIQEEVEDNECRYGVKTHFWYVFKCDTQGEARQNYEEAKSIGWYTPEEIKNLTLEPIWSYWFKRLGVI